MRKGSIWIAPLLAIPAFAAASGSPTVIDPAGSVWRTGKSSYYATTADAFQPAAVSSVCGTQQLSPFQTPTAISCNHAYVVRQDSGGRVLYATYLAGSSEDGGTAITADAQGNIYVAGYTYSGDFPVTAGAAQAKNAGPLTPFALVLGGFPFGPATVQPGGDVFVAKISPAGKLLFSTLLGGSGSDVPTLIGVDAAGSVYVSGTTVSPDFPVTAGALSHQTQAHFFSRLSANGQSLTYSTYSDATIQSFDIDAQGVAHLTGSSAGNGGPYVAAIDTAAGTLLHSTLLASLDAGVSGAGTAIGVGSSGNLIVGTASYLLELAAGGSRILNKTAMSQAQFDSILFDSDGNSYAFGHGKGALPGGPPPLLAAPCSSAGGSFAIVSNAAGGILATTYLRQADDTAPEIASPGRVALYRSASNSTVTLDLTGQPALNFGCPENLATGAVGAGIAPGEIFAVFGYGLGPAQGIAGAPDGSGRYPTSLGGVQLLINGKAAPLLFVQAGEIHAVAPFSLPFPATLEVQYNSQGTPPLDAPATDVNPGIFTVGGQGAIVNQDGTVNTPSNPAKLGSIISVYCTGTGYLESPVVDGALTPLPPPFVLMQLTPRVTFAGVDGTVLWAGAAPAEIAGVMQINVQLPATLPQETALNAVPVVLSVSGVLSAPVAVSVAVIL